MNIKKSISKLTLETLNQFNMTMMVAGTLCLAVGAYFNGATLNKVCPVEKGTSELMMICGLCVVLLGAYHTWIIRPLKTFRGGACARWLSIVNVLLALGGLVLAIIYLLQLRKIEEKNLQNLIESVWAYGKRDMDKLIARSVENGTDSEIIYEPILKENSTTEYVQVTSDTPTMLKVQIQKHFECCGLYTVTEYCRDPQKAYSELIEKNEKLNQEKYDKFINKHPEHTETPFSEWILSINQDEDRFDQYWVVLEIFWIRSEF